MNLYTPAKRIADKTRPVNSHTLYLATLLKSNPNTDVDFNLVQTLQNEDKKLYVLSSTGKYYLSDGYMVGTGIANVLYSSHNSARTIKYGKQLLGLK